MRALPPVIAALLVLAPVVVVTGGPATATPVAGPTSVGGGAGPLTGPGVDDGSGDGIAAEPTATPAPGSDEQPSGDRTADGAARQVSNGSSGNRTVHVLALPAGGVARSVAHTRHADLGPSLGFASNATGARIETVAMIERIESAGSTAQRQRLILGRLNEIEQRAISLDRLQGRAIEAYSDGEIGARGFVFHLARIGAEARALEARRERLARLIEETEDFGLDEGRLAALERELDTFTGPVRAHAVAVVRGERPPTRFYVATGEAGVVLATIVDGTYVREVYRSDLRNRGPGTISPDVALNTTIESYPVIWRTRSEPAQVVGSGNSYLVRVTHRRGALSAFIDSGTERVFKEFQRRSLETMDEGEPVSDVRDDLRLTVNRTYPGGPLRVRLAEDATGDPVNANITVGLEGEESDFVGRTGADGELWTLAPNGRFTVTAIKGNSVVVLTTEPAPAPRVNVTAGGGTGSTGGQGG